MVKPQDSGVEDALAARNGFRSWAADQGGIHEGEQSLVGNESSACGQVERFESCVRVVVPGEPTCEPFDEGGTHG